MTWAWHVQLIRREWEWRREYGYGAETPGKSSHAFNLETFTMSNSKNRNSNNDYKNDNWQKNNVKPNELYFYCIIPSLRNQKNHIWISVYLPALLGQTYY